MSLVSPRLQDLPFPHYVSTIRKGDRTKRGIKRGEKGTRVATSDASCKRMSPGPDTEKTAAVLPPVKAKP